MKKTFPFLIVITIFFSCRKPTDVITPEVDSTTNCDCDYTSYTDSNYDYILESLSYESPVEISINYVEDYSYVSPVFNPNNPCQIAYVRINISSVFPYTIREVWKFDFNTGESTLLAENYIADLDWGSNGWLIYSGYGDQVYKVKANGDSMAQVTDGNGAYYAGKWNPSSTVFWVNGAGAGAQYLNLDGEVQYVSTQNSIRNLDWINDTTIFGKGGDIFKSKSFPSEDLTILSDIELSVVGIDYVFDRENMNCYVYFCNDMECYFSRIDLSGSNEIDTLRPWIDSYHYFGRHNVERIGDIVDDKFIITLTRDAQNSLPNITIDRRENMVIMDLDCNNERMVVIPE